MNDRKDTANAPWLERVSAEIVRGKHVIVHGNVHDEVRWRSRHASLCGALTGILTAWGYRTIGFYDVVDGLTGDDLPHLMALANGQADGADGEAPAARPADPTENAQTRRLRERAEEQERQRSASGPGVPALDPAAAVSAIRRLLAQEVESVAVVVDFAELLVTAPDRAESEDRQLLGALKKAMLEAAYVGDRRNLLIMIVPDLPVLPEWLYQGEPFVQPIEALRPGFDERLEYFRENARRFHLDEDAEPWTGDSLRVLANLSDGMAVTELAGLWRTSQRQGIGLHQPRELVNRTLVGRTDDPWARLGGRIAGAEAYLSRKVVGQPLATERVSQSLAAATLGIDFVADTHSVEARPKGVFFFVGPTGVGKTELAKAMSELIYDDAAALARFDMSSFSQEHAVERLTGAPPGYLGHERGGELTNRVRQRPFSLLLFDEIEKAHDSIFDRFLQILDDGRLTDGLGRTSYFSQTLIVFTSNLGAREIYEQVHKGGEIPFSEVARMFEEAVTRHFTSERVNRPELLGRLGNGIIPFDILRPENIDLITAKFLDQLVRTAERTADLVVETDSVLQFVRAEMADPGKRALGARRIRDILDRTVRAPLVRALIAGGSGTYDVWFPPFSQEASVTRRTAP